jgi:hypothetical protein
MAQALRPRGPSATSASCCPDLTRNRRTRRACPATEWPDLRGGRPTVETQPRRAERILRSGRRPGPVAERDSFGSQPGARSPNRRRQMMVLVTRAPTPRSSGCGCLSHAIDRTRRYARDRGGHRGRPDTGIGERPGARGVPQAWLDQWACFLRQGCWLSPGMAPSRCRSLWRPRKRLRRNLVIYPCKAHSHFGH